MVKNLINLALRPLGFQIVRRCVPREGMPSFVLYPYTRPDGCFDYDRYRQVQQEGNRSKLDWVWVQEENIEFLAHYIRDHVPQPQFGICHGTRRGMEQEWFRRHLGCEVIGTEISDTASQFPHTMQWDFHDVKPEWINAADFIYSNSLDHSYDPEKALNAWMSCLKPTGLCVIEHSSLHEPQGANELDPFGADIHIMPYLIATWGRGRFGVRELVSAPRRDPQFIHVDFIVLRRF